MKKVINVIDKFNERIAIYVGGSVLFALVFATALNIVLRYVFNMPFKFVLELDENLMVALAFFTGGYALLLDAHVRMDVVFHRLTAKQRAIQEIVTYPLVWIFFGVLIYYGASMTYEAWEFNATTPGMEWPYWPTYILVPFGGILLILQSFVTFARAVMFLSENRSDDSQKEG